MVQHGQLRRVIASNEEGITAMGAHDRSKNDNEQRKGASHDGIDRRDFLNCMAWAGTWLLWTSAAESHIPSFCDTHSPAKAGSEAQEQMTLSQWESLPDERVLTLRAEKGLWQLRIRRIYVYASPAFWRHGWDGEVFGFPGPRARLPSDRFGA